jgi:hypothetical protein
MTNAVISLWPTPATEVWENLKTQSPLFRIRPELLLLLSVIKSACRSLFPYRRTEDGSFHRDIGVKGVLERILPLVAWCQGMGSFLFQTGKKTWL